MPKTFQSANSPFQLPDNPMLIQELELHTNDLLAQKTFYTTQLGFSLLAETTDRLTLQAGGSKLTFLKTHLVGATPNYHFAFNIPSNQLNEAAAWLKAQQIELLQTGKTEEDEPLYTARFDDWNAEAVYFRDPSGNIVEFIARQEFVRPSSKPFSTVNILRISEIGLVAVGKNSKEYAAELRDKYDITSFQKGVNGLDFWALGGDSGLLLVFAPTRPYFPTEQLAERFPLKLWFQNRKNIDCELEIF